MESQSEGNVVKDPGAVQSPGYSDSGVANAGFCSDEENNTINRGVEGSKIDDLNEPDEASVNCKAPHPAAEESNQLHSDERKNNASTNDDTPATLQIEQVSTENRPSSLPIDKRFGASSFDSSKYQGGMAMSPSYYMLTPSDELSLGESESPRSPRSNDSTSPIQNPLDFDKLFHQTGLWEEEFKERNAKVKRKKSDPWATDEVAKDCLESSNDTCEASSAEIAQNCDDRVGQHDDSAEIKHSGLPVMGNIQPVEVAINQEDSGHPQGEGSSKRKKIHADQGMSNFGSYSRESSLDGTLDLPEAIGNGDLVNGAACISIGEDTLESSTDPPDNPPKTSRSLQDITLTIDRDRPSVSYRATSNSFSNENYGTDVVMLEEIKPRFFSPTALKNAQHVATVIPTECHGWTGANINPDTMPVQLIQLGVPEENYAKALNLLGKDMKIAYHTFFYNKWLQICLFSAVFITLWMLGFLLWHTGGLPDRIGIGLFFILAWLFMVIGLVLCRIARNKMNKRTESTLSQVNELLLKHKVIMGVEDKGAMSCNKVILHFVYFEEGSCLERIIDDLAKGLQKNRKIPKPVKQERKDASPEVDIDESDLIIDERESTEGYRQVLARRLLLKYSGMYVKRLMTERLPRPSERRHAGNIPCLCQFVERHYFKLYEVLAMI